MRNLLLFSVGKKSNKRTHPCAAVIPETIGLRGVGKNSLLCWNAGALRHYPNWPYRKGPAALIRSNSLPTWSTEPFGSGPHRNGFQGGFCKGGTPMNKVIY